MAVNYAELAKRLQATPVDQQGALGVEEEERVDFSTLESRYGSTTTVEAGASETMPVLMGAPKKTGGFFAGLARVVAPLGESIGTALAGKQAKKMEAETSARGEELARVAISLIRNPNLSAQQKERALRAMQISKGTGVIEQSGAFNETAGQTFGKGLSTLGALTAGAGAGLASKFGLKGGAGLAARTLGEAAVGGTTYGLGGGLQEEKRGGELAKSVLTSALISGAFNVAAEGAGALAEYVAKKLPARTINSILKTNKKDFLYGKNPGQGVVDEGIVANTPSGFIKEINAKRRAIGEEIGNELKQATNAGKTVDLTPAMKPIDNAIDAAVKRGDRALYARLNSLKEEMVGIFKEANGGIERVGTKNLFSITPEKARVIKTELGEATKWTGQAFDGDVNSLRSVIYNRMDGIIDVAVPAAKSLNSRYANLLGAEKALEKAVLGAQGQNLVRLNTLLTGLGAAGGAATGDGLEDRVVRGVAGAGFAAAVRSPATLTRLAQMARRANPTSLPANATLEMLKRLSQSALQSGLK